MQHIHYLLEHFGYIGIVIALVGGIVGLPIPDEILLTYVGYNVSQGIMHYIPSLLSAFIGAVGGISLSFLLGKKLGLPILLKFGPKINLTAEKIDKTRKMFEKFGPFLLFIGYFIPGVRHVTAYLAGINSFPFRKFAAFAYAGAALWGFSFITLGKVLGKNWGKVEFYFSKYSIILGLIIGLGVIVFIFWRSHLKSKEA
ncbi:DedA family protein [Bacillus sp. FJAT-29790]|uniref:DedA family protein n=1 Tax=Bacillus sp. FJAT-29790 TaxID=1895002 RepID=UPI001C236297|nr:DedA family protein [Bacillus sp. FJAT-29790]MBU8878444.1 DedA family protein [Bacillus sp. FJAT-29790]